MAREYNLNEYRNFGIMAHIKIAKNIFFEILRRSLIRNKIFLW